MTNCRCCGTELSPDDEHEADSCEECLDAYRDILNSEEARSYGAPYKLQIWSDESPTSHFGEVEVTCVNYSTVCFKDPQREGRTTCLPYSEFAERFRFVRTTY